MLKLKEVTNQVDREEVEWVENRARELCTGNERNKVETITAVRNVMINAYRATRGGHLVSVARTQSRAGTVRGLDCVRR